jgi:hypothetical protein
MSNTIQHRTTETHPTAPSRYIPEYSQKKLGNENFMYDEGFNKATADHYELAALATELAAFSDADPMDDYKLESALRYINKSEVATNNLDAARSRTSNALGKNVVAKSVGGRLIMVPQDYQLLSDESLEASAKNELDKLIPEFVTRVMALYETAITKGIIPDYVRDRLPSLMKLDYRTIIGRNDRAEGTYNPISQVIRIIMPKNEIEAEVLIKETLFNIFLHECTHHLSGEVTKNVKGVENHVRGGLTFIRKDKSNFNRPKSYVWADEAMTEHITQSLLYSLDGSTVVTDGIFYTYFRKCLKDLVEVSGIPLQDFVDAYFESAKISESKRHTYMDLMRNIGEVFNPNFFHEYSKGVEDYKTDYASFLLKKRTNIPE